MTEQSEHPEEQSEPEPTPEPEQPPEPGPPRQVRFRFRRAPRYRAFVVTGVLVGVVAALVIARLGPPSASYSAGATAGYLVVVLGLIGAVLGGAAAVLAERRSR